MIIVMYPLVHGFIGDIHLRIEYPQETKAIFAKIFNLKVHNLLIAHSVIIKRELTIRKHELAIILLASLDSPRGIHEDDVEVADTFSHEF